MPSAGSIPGARSSSGGLVIKAGLADEEPAVILGLLTAAKRVLSGQNAAESRRRWKEIGDKAFHQV